VLKGLQGGVGHFESDDFRTAVEVVEYDGWKTAQSPTVPPASGTP
jgi:hypothetical protein